MSDPLLTPEETFEYEIKKTAISKEYNEIQALYEAGGRNYANYPKEAFDKNSKKSKALHEGIRIKTVRRAQARPDEFVNALLVHVGSKGTEYVDFDRAFEGSDDPIVVEGVTRHNTPEVRRALYTILKAFTEIPKSWGTSAVIRFFRGNGKQKGTSFHGAGNFAAPYGWKEDEIKAVIENLTRGRYSYGYDAHATFAECLMSNKDVMEEMYEARQQAREEGKDEYEEVPGNEFAATRIERDKDFLNKLCGILEARGLGPIPIPAEVKAPKPHKAKEFKSGDIVKKTTIRDLPLPAHLRLKIKKRKHGQPGVPGEESTGTIDIIVTSLNTGGYRCLFVKPENNKAYHVGYYSDCGHKQNLEGATFIGKWTGEMMKKERGLELGFSWWVDKD